MADGTPITSDGGVTLTADDGTTILLTDPVAPPPTLNTTQSILSQASQRMPGSVLFGAGFIRRGGPLLRG